MLIGAPTAPHSRATASGVNAVKLSEERRQRVGVLPRELKSV
jgi:hypothetical protein